MEDKDILKKAGLNESQAKIYYALLTNGELTPAQIAEKSGESRENCYLVVKKLEELELIEKLDKKKATYRPLNPTNLEILAEKRRRAVQRNEKIVKDNMSLLLDIFYANNEIPGSKSLEGLEGIKEVYNDILRCKEDVYLLRTRADTQTREIARDFLKKYKEERARLGIETYALTPDSPEGRRHQPDDKINRYHRTIMPIDAYTVPVEIHVYGNKISFVAFGERPMSTFITSPAMADAMRQIIKIMMEYYKKTYDKNKDLAFL